MRDEKDCDGQIGEVKRRWWLVPWLECVNNGNYHTPVMIGCRVTSWADRRYAFELRSLLIIRYSLPVISISHSPLWITAVCYRDFPLHTLSSPQHIPPGPAQLPPRAGVIHHVLSSQVSTHPTRHRDDNKLPPNLIIILCSF